MTVVRILMKAQKDRISLFTGVENGGKYGKRVCIYCKYSLHQDAKN